MSVDQEVPGGVGRLAPSPTGHLHLGHARSFLIAWWQARKRGGQIRLRFEDLDHARSRQQFIDDTLTDLEWLGLDWDGPVLRQSERIEPIRELALDLQSAGLAYWCVCSRGDIQARSAPHGADGAPIYGGTCDGRFTDLAEAEKTGEPAGLRLRVGEGAVQFTDSVAGVQTQRLSLTTGDFLLLRRDKLPAYQLAVVADDDAQGVTEVIRGDDLLASTPRQIALLDALGLKHPNYAHVPLVLDESGHRLAKRHASLSLKILRDAGIDARALVRFLLASCGAATKDRLSAAEAVPLFELARLPKKPLHVNEQSLVSLLRDSHSS